ncbi:hypothetical protein, partial [Paenibacillus plantarum]|uniref:hypothetical protein n=1 Tax=Paenibacillus plantarum TaxID=2654975 RepID=UPI001C1152B9
KSLIAHLKLARFCNLFFERLLVRAYSLVVQFSKINFFHFLRHPFSGDFYNISHPNQSMQAFFISLFFQLRFTS